MTRMRWVSLGNFFNFLLFLYVRTSKGMGGDVNRKTSVLQNDKVKILFLQDSIQTSKKMLKKSVIRIRNYRFFAKGKKKLLPKASLNQNSFFLILALDAANGDQYEAIRILTEGLDKNKQ